MVDNIMRKMSSLDPKNSASRGSKDSTSLDPKGKASLPNLATVMVKNFLLLACFHIHLPATTEYCLILPLCWPTIQFIQVKVAGEMCKSIVHIAIRTRLF